MKTTRSEAFEAPAAIARVRVVDSHTGGEPTRVVVDGGPDLGGGSMAERRERMRDRHDAFRAAVVNEPRGSEVVVGALLCEPVDPTCTAGVIFFNNVGYLGMCGHGLCGLIVTLAHLGRIGEGRHRIETPVGTVEAELEGEHRVTFANVPSYRHATGVRVRVPGIGPVQGDVAWGGNWFFLVEQHGQRLARDNVAALSDYCRKVKEALAAQSITGDRGQMIDHIELFGPPASPDCHSRNFVLCPGDAYDRSPCGTGTSAKVACLVADRKLAPGEIWRQESLIGSRFEAWTDSRGDGPIVPRLRGTAYVCAEATLLFHPEDPLRGGIA